MTQRMLWQAKRGNADAFAALCAPYEGHGIPATACKCCAITADAQDAALETMLKAYRAFRSFEGRSELADVAVQNRA